MTEIGKQVKRKGNNTETEGQEQKWRLRKKKH